MPGPKEWVMARMPASQAGDTGPETAGRERRPEKEVDNTEKEADRIATLLHFGVKPAEEIEALRLNPVSYWLWVNTEGEGAEDALVMLLRHAVKEWHPYVSHPTVTKQYAKKSVQCIEEVLRDRLGGQVCTGMMEGQFTQ